MQPTFALDALYDQVTLGIRVVTAGTRDKRGARAALCTSVHPGTVETRIGRAACAARSTPLIQNLSLKRPPTNFHTKFIDSLRDNVKIKIYIKSENKTDFSGGFRQGQITALMKIKRLFFIKKKTYFSEEHNF